MKPVILLTYQKTLARVHGHFSLNHVLMTVLLFVIYQRSIIHRLGLLCIAKPQYLQVKRVQEQELFYNVTAV